MYNVSTEHVNLEEVPPANFVFDFYWRMDETASVSGQEAATRVPWDIEVTLLI